MVHPEILATVDEMWRNSASAEEILAFLRAKGVSKGESFLVLVERFEIPMDEAKPIVHFSQTWKDTRQVTEELHHLLERVVTTEIMDVKDLQTKQELGEEKARGHPTARTADESGDIHPAP